MWLKLVPHIFTVWIMSCASRIVLQYKMVWHLLLICTLDMCECNMSCHMNLCYLWIQSLSSSNDTSNRIYCLVCLIVFLAFPETLLLLLGLPNYCLFNISYFLVLKESSCCPFKTHAYATTPIISQMFCIVSSTFRSCFCPGLRFYPFFFMS
jgi:hypothetical protein